MRIDELLAKIDSLKTEIDSLLPMKCEDERRLWDKIRLDWNYNSNHIEGNTLTYGETKLLLLFEKTTGNHDKREYDEMQAHDVALHLIKDMAKDKEQPLTESFIEELNKIILKQPYWKEAITADGQPTRRLIKVGDYKDVPNSVLLQNGQMLHYASPDETRPMMEELINFYRTYDASSEAHPVWLAAMFHYKFVRIHPFDDGNGRIARLIMNYILMRKGYPPAIVLSADKKNYLFALNKADAGDMEWFVVYIGEQVVRSLQMNSRAVKGESIEEPDDTDKQLELIKRKLKERKGIKIKKSREVLQSLYSNSLLKLFNAVEMKFAKFDDMFNDAERIYIVKDAVETHGTDTSNPQPTNKSLQYIDKQINFDINSYGKYGKVSEVDYNRGGILRYINTNNPYQYPDIYLIELHYTWKGFKNNGVDTFHQIMVISIDMQEYKYIVRCSVQSIEPIVKLYDEYLTDEECSTFVNKIMKVLVNEIGQRTNSSSNK